jgi:hypothetical protein
LGKNSKSGNQKMISDAFIEMGWGRLVFGHTFSSISGQGSIESTDPRALSQKNRVILSIIITDHVIQLL